MTRGGVGVAEGGVGPSARTEVIFLMEWLVEPLAGFDAPVLNAKGSCTGGSTLNHCSCIRGLFTCECGNGLVIHPAEQEGENSN